MVNKSLIITFFRLVHVLIISTLLAGGYAIFTTHTYQPGFYFLGVTYAKLAVVILSITLLPGILSRLGIQFKPVLFIHVFRRQFGVTVFWLALAHFHLVRQFYRLSGVMPLNPPFPLFEVIGSSALFLMTFMWLTSNNWSVAKLGPWWKRLHRLVYLIIWLIFLHTALQRLSFWSLLAGTTAILEITSWIYYFLKPKTV